jgi:hypothetical protein
MLFKRLKQARRAKKAREQNAQFLRQKALMTELHLQSLAINSRDAGVIDVSRPQRIVVTLTTFDKRINDVHLTIESIFQQSLKADKVVLCIAKEDFDPAALPELLKLQMKRGLEVEFCEKDLGPHTKYFYTVQKYPNDLIVTIDDDIMYPVDMLDQLYRAYVKEPAVIHCHRGHGMVTDGNAVLRPYKEWKRTVRDSKASLSVFQTGVGGVLYFPGCFDQEVLNQEVFEALSPKADDVWLKAMSLKKGTRAKTIQDSRDWGHRFLVIDGSQKFKLKTGNKSTIDGNDVQMKRVLDHYSMHNAIELRKG